MFTILSDMMVPGESFEHITNNIIVKIIKESAYMLLSTGEEDLLGTKVTMGTAWQLGIPPDKILVKIVRLQSIMYADNYQTPYINR